MTSIQACENCTAPLHGDYCHRCGQSIHNPIRHARHAIEEFFEAFWHLDGRLWHTLRDLMVPGRTAGEYLAGHRARYIPPLRMFVVLSVLTFFIGAMAIRVEREPLVEVDSAITQAQTVEEVERERDRLLAEIAQARAEASNVPGVDLALIESEVGIRQAAGNRIAQLRAGRDDGATATAENEADGTRSAPAPAPASGGEAPRDSIWDAESDPIAIPWLPGFVNRWLTAEAADVRDSLARMDGRTDLYFEAFMASVPSALFVLVPVFALLLKLAYALTPRLYLEHMVVALYSHAFLLIALTVAFLLSALGTALTPLAGWLGSACSLLFGAVLTWMPVYLLLMQKRVYRQGWTVTVVKYLAIGFVYFWLLIAATLIMFALRLAQA